MQRRALLLGATALLLNARLAPARERRDAALRLAVHRDVHTDYLRFVGARDPLRITDFSGPWSRRDVVETVLLQQALRRGGLTLPIRFVLADSYARQLRLLATGDADISGSSAWKLDADAQPERLAVSQAVIGPGRFEAGLYFPQGHDGLAQVALNPAQLRNYTAVCSRDWLPDRLTLEALGVKVLLTENWDSMLGMLQKRRADFLLAPFQPNADFRITRDALVLLPVPGLKVGLVGTRHFLVSRAHPASAQWLAQLDRGLSQLEKDGTLARAYVESGFHDRRVRTWRRLGPV